MKLEDLLEAPIASLPREAQSFIAKDMEKLGAMAVKIANEIEAGNKKAYLADLEELDYYYKRIRSQIFQ